MRTRSSLFAQLILASAVLLKCSVDDKSDYSFSEGGSGGTDPANRGGEAGAGGMASSSGGSGAAAGAVHDGGDVSVAGGGSDNSAGAGANTSAGAPTDGASGSGGSAGQGPEGGAGGTSTGGAGGTAGKAATGGAGGTAGTAATGGAGGTAGKAATGGAGGTAGKAGTGGAATGGTPGWCATNPAPTGVLAADYQCVDFEPGLPASTVWKGATTPNQGKASLSTDRASSPTHSLLSAVGAESAFGAADDASLTWRVVGAAAVVSVSASAEINPSSWAGVSTPWSGSVDLLCVEFGSGNTCLSYTRGADTSFATGYTGYLVSHVYSGGPAYFDDIGLSGTLDANLWNRVELRVTSSTGAIQVFVNGVLRPFTAKDGSTSFTGSHLNDTTATVQVGLQSNPLTTLGWNVYFDNVRVSVFR